MEETAAALETLFAGGTVTSAPGAHYAFDELVLLPRPIQERLPIMIGGSGEKKTLRTVARHADMWNAMGSVEKSQPQGRGPARPLRRRRPRHRRHRVHRAAASRSSARPRRRRDALWRAQMANNRTPMTDVLDDDTFWVGTPELIAERMVGAQGARLPHVPRRDGRAVRRRDARSLDQRGPPDGRRRLTRRRRGRRYDVIVAVSGFLPRGSPEWVPGASRATRVNRSW